MGEERTGGCSRRRGLSSTHSSVADRSGASQQRLSSAPEEPRCLRLWCFKAALLVAKESLWQELPASGPVQSASPPPQSSKSHVLRSRQAGGASRPLSASQVLPRLWAGQLAAAGP